MAELQNAALSTGGVFLLFVFIKPAPAFDEYQIARSAEGLLVAVSKYLPV
ncbi:MAG: hypothetical protein WCD70_12080 [Alphaproteobacteria bacterium]